MSRSTGKRWNFWKKDSKSRAERAMNRTGWSFLSMTRTLATWKPTSANSRRSIFHSWILFEWNRNGRKKRNRSKIRICQTNLCVAIQHSFHAVSYPIDLFVQRCSCATGWNFVRTPIRGANNGVNFLHSSSPSHHFNRVERTENWLSIMTRKLEKTQVYGLGGILSLSLCLPLPINQPSTCQCGYSMELILFSFDRVLGQEDSWPTTFMNTYKLLSY